MARSAPDWPALMRRDLARLYVDMSSAEFERAVAADQLPQPVSIQGQERWSRAELDAHLDRLLGNAGPDWLKECKLFKRDAAA